MSDLEERVQRLEDRNAILTLVARYYNAVDDRDIDLVGSLFCEDGVFGRYNGTDRVEGRAAIEAFYNERLGPVGPSFHYPHAHIIEFDSDTSATGVVTAHAEMGIQGKMVITGFRYQDKYRKDPDGEWRFLERLTRFYYFMSHEDLHDHYEDPVRIRWPGEPMPADLPDSLPTWRAFKGLE
jgi:uncharacterized protein (TIGR02246 family)